MTNQYINRETVKRELLSWAVNINHPEYLIKDDALHVIDSMPAADMVEVVRCNDCKHCNISLVIPNGRVIYTCMEGSHDHQTLLDPNDFCSRGERSKEND